MNKDYDSFVFTSHRFCSMLFTRSLDIVLAFGFLAFLFYMPKRQYTSLDSLRGEKGVPLVGIRIQCGFGLGKLNDCDVKTRAKCVHCTCTAKEKHLNWPSISAN
jgi:hypothetical protein